jgi:WD40 repeat protein
VARSSTETVTVWDADDGREIVTFKRSEPQVLWQVKCAAASPDGERIVIGWSGGDNLPAEVYDTVHGQELFQLGENNENAECAAFSPDGRQIVTGGLRRKVKVWDAVSGRQMLELENVALTCTCVSFSPEGQRGVKGDSAGIEVWSLSDKRKLWRNATGPGFVSSAAWSPDGGKIVSGIGGAIIVWDARDGRKLLECKGQGSGMSVDYSPDGTRLLTAGQTARLWDAVTGRELLVLKGQDVTSAAFSPDGSRIVTSSQDGTLKIWDAPR